MASDKTASFAIKVDSNAGEVSGDAVSSLEQLRQQIKGSNDAVKEYGASLRLLRGKSDEVKVAKEELKAKIEAERGAVSQAALAIHNLGTNYEKLAEQERASAKVQLKEKIEAERKAAVDATKAVAAELAMQRHASAEASKAIVAQLAATKALDARNQGLKASLTQINAPLISIVQRFESMKQVTAQAGGGIGTVVLAMGALGAAAVAVTVGVAAASAGLLHFIVDGANAARSAGLLREATAGTAKNAAALGSQVGALAAKVPTAKEELNGMAIGLARALSGTTVSGKGIVDTFNAVAQASSAMGDEAGAQIGEIVKRSKMMGRIQINPLELQGTGLTFEDVAQSLGKSMKGGVAAARAALFEGTVQVDAGAKALRVAVEKRFAELNTRKMLDLGVAAAKFKEKLTDLTKDVNLEPLLKGLSEIGSLFDKSTVTGAALKTVITTLGNEIGPAFKAAVPIIKGFLKGMAIGGLDVAIAFFQVKNAIRDAFGGGDVLGRIISIENAVTIGKVAMYGLAAAVTAVGVGIAGLAAVTIGPFAALASGIYVTYEKVKAVGWKGLGLYIVQGIADGLAAAGGLLVDSVSAMAEKVKGAFKDALGIHSPSKVFEGYGKQTGKGYAQGMDQGAPAAQAAADRMAPSPPRGAAGGGAGGGGGGSVVVNVALNVSGGGDAQSTAKALSDPSFLAQLTKAVEDALLGAGVPIQQQAAA